MGQVIAWEHCHYHNSTENIMLRLWATPGETAVEGKVKLVTPVAMTQRGRNKEEMPSRSQAMQRKSLLHGPPTSTPTESAVLGDEETAWDGNRGADAKSALPLSQDANLAAHSRRWDQDHRRSFDSVSPTPAPPPWAHRGSPGLNLLKKASQVLASVPFMHLLETSLNWHRWVREMLPSNKQAETLSYWTLIKWQFRI